MFEKGDSSNRQKNERLLRSVDCMAKFELVFVPTQKNTFCWRFHGTKDFQDKLLSERSTCFNVIITENFKHF